MQIATLFAQFMQYLKILNYYRFRQKLISYVVQMFLRECGLDINVHI